MRKMILAGAVCFVLPIAAFSQTMSDNGTSLSRQDTSFIKSATDAGLAEVADGKLAESQGGNAVQQIGQRMVTDHSKANEQLAKISHQFGDPVPTETDVKHQAMHATLATLSGDQFDSQYLKDQLQSHEKAIALFKKEISDGSNPQLVKFASSTLPTLEMHLSMIKSVMKQSTM